MTRRRSAAQPLAGLAALGLSGVMVGAVVTHLLVLPPAALAVIPAALALVLLLIAQAHWPQTRALLVPLMR